ncbi:hypothetical protein A5772_13600 [Mycolicibacter sinensis]|uniref:Uncharacterized protein n=1 Tax=Mycolicibacter sinensis (strain JDM601) TaxID=875328 RepID=A0A1A2E8T6_MYCSD|nr:hypothetical protein A5772_13600 [Mycolicibacter sinensis]OBG00914.1 hypothetical protein A5771_17765 [Mycolicibacter sinensis]
MALGRPNPPPLDEITNLLRWLFGEHDGVLPFDVVNEFNPTGRYRPKDRKITRLKQVFDNYDQIREMRMGNKPDGLVASAGNHNLARPSVPNLKAKVEELVSRFSAVRTMEPDDFMRNNFRTTFRIMLDRDRRSYDQIKLVVDNLGSPRVQEYLDVSRYQDAYWLRQEFDHAYEIMAAVLTAPTCDSSTVPSKPEAWITAERTDEQDRFEEFVPDRRHTSPSDQDDDGQVSNDAICSKFGQLADL